MPRGFTVLELLGIVLILAILMAIAMPLYMSAIADGQAKTCRLNMQAIANAERSQKLRSASHAYATVTAGGMTQTWVNANLPDLQPLVLCPTGGSYSMAVYTTGTHTSNGVTVPNGNLIITCSSHGTFAPGIDPQ